MMKRILKWSVYLLLSFAAVLFILFLTKDRTGYFVFKHVLKSYAGRAGIVLDTGSMKGDLFSRTTVKTISLRPADGLPQDYHFRADELTCTYNIWDLKKGASLFLQGVRCSVNRPYLAVDLQSETPGKSSWNRPSTIFPMDSAPHIDVHNGTLILHHSEWGTEADNITGKLAPEDGKKLTLELGADDLRLDRKGITRIATGFNSLLHLEGKMLSIDSLVIGKNDISGSGRIDLARLNDGVIDLTSEILFAESRLNISGSLRNRLLTGMIKTDMLDIGALQKKIGWTGGNIDGTLRGNIAFAWNMDRISELQSTFDVGMQSGHVRGMPVDSLFVSGDIGQQNLKVTTAEIKSRANLVTIKDLTVPITEIRPDNLPAVVRKTRAQFHLDLKNVVPILQLITKVDEIPEAVRPRSVKLDGHLGKGIVNISEALFEAEDTRLAIRDAAIPIPEKDEFFDLTILKDAQAKFHADMGNATPVLKLLQTKAIIPEAVQPRSIKLDGYLEKGTIHINEALLETKDSRLTILKGAVAIPGKKEELGRMPVSASARFESADINRYVQLIDKIPVHGGLAAGLELTGTVREPAVDIVLKADKLMVNDQHVGTLAVSGAIQAHHAIPGKHDRLELNITHLVQQNGSGTISLASPTKATLAKDGLTLQAALELDHRAELHIKLDKPVGHDLAAEITGRHIESDGWLSAFINDRLFFNGADISAVLTNWPGNPVLKATGKVDSAGEKNVPFPFSGSYDLQYSLKGIEIKDFTWVSLGRNRLSLTGHLPFDPANPDPYLADALSLKAHVDFPVLEDIGFLLEPYGITKGSVKLDASLSGTWKNPLGSLELTAKGLPPAESLKKYLNSDFDLSCSLDAKGDRIVLNSAALDSAEYSVQASGTWQHNLAARELLRQDLAELPGEVKAEASVKVKNLGIIADRIDWLRRLDGDLQGSVVLSGPLKDPELHGTFTLRQGEIIHTLNFPKLSAVTLSGTFDRNSVNVDDLRAELGGSPISARGLLYKENGATSVRLKADGTNILLFRDNDMWVRGDVRLEAAGPLGAMTISGETALTGGYYTKNIDLLGLIGSSPAPVTAGVNFLFSFPDPPFRDAVFNIRITAAEPFRIRNNLIRSSLRPDLTLKGTGELPYLVGVVYIDPSRILLPAGRLQVRSGLLRFLEKEPDRPQLNLLASSKVLDYDINVLTQGPIDEPVITLSSSPPLPNEDLLLLLLTGQPPQKETSVGAKSSGTRNVLVYISRDFLNKWLEEDIGSSDETILDRFDLDYGRGITRSGEQTFESTFRLTDRSGATGRVYYLTGEKDRYDAYNYGLKMVFRFE